MTDEQWAAIVSLREDGYAVTVFTPEELSNVDSDDVETRMCIAGNEEIDYRTEDEDDHP